MGFLGRLLGYEDYFKEKFDEMIEVIREGFTRTNVRLGALEKRKPVIKQEITQKVSISQEEFNEMLKNALKDESITMDLIKREVVRGTKEEPSSTVSKGTNVQYSTVSTVPGRLTQTHQKIINTISSSNFPLTYKQISEKLGLKTNSVKARISEIKKANLPIEETRIDRQKAYSMSIDYKSKILKQPY